MAKTLLEAKEEVGKALNELLKKEIYVHNIMLNYNDVINLLIIDEMNKKSDSIENTKKLKEMYLAVKKIDKQLPNTFASDERKELQLKKAFYIGYLKAYEINIDSVLENIIQGKIYSSDTEEQIIKKSKH